MVTAAAQTVRLSDKPRSRPSAGREGVRIITGRDGRAYFDAAASVTNNEKHWAYASEFDLNSLIRQDLSTLRKRARYEIVNNCYGAGISDTLADYVVGTGPRPQVRSGPTKETDNPAFNAECEQLFCAWSNRCEFTGTVEFAEFLRMQFIAQQCDSGESITVFKRDPDVGPYDVALRLLAVEPDRLDNPFGSTGDTRRLHDGIEFDDLGRVRAYHIMKDHPCSGYVDSILDFDKVQASQVIHLYRVKQPGQHRGIPWFAPALPLFSKLRRFTLATVDNAESAANLWAVMKNTTGIGAIDPDANETPESNDVVDLERNAFLTLPAGWDISQLNPSHPATTYQMFKSELINEIARCVNMPFNIAAANSSDYNYASGRLDHQAFYRFIQTIRAWAERRYLARVFSAWLSEAWLIPGYFKSGPTFEQAMYAIASVKWYWSGFKHVDPVKEAQAQAIRLESNMTTLRDEYAEAGADWEEQLNQISIEQKRMRELGIVPVSTKTMKTEDDDDADTSKTQKKAAQKK